MTRAQAPIAWHRQPALQQRLRLLDRLAHMEAREIAHRLGRLLGKWTARAQPTAVTEDGLEPTDERAAPAGFFDGAARTRRAAIARERLPADVARTLRMADAILGDGIDLLGRRFRPADPGFDWHADPEQGALWPLTVLDDADAVRGVRADVKPVWEVNRHQFLVTLARAFVYGGDERHAHATVAMVRRWIAANPAGRGVNWASNLEVAIRALSWVWAIDFLAGTDGLSSGDLRLWLASLRQHRDHLASHLSIYTDPTNHLIGEAAALAVLALWRPEWEGSAALAALALGTLEREITRQVAEDGVDREQSTSYQRFVFDLLLQVIVLADRTRVALPPVLRARASKMLEAAHALTGPGGRAPRIGDSDDARGLPFFTADHWDFGEMLALGAGVLDRPDLRADGDRLYESVLWVGGEAALAPRRLAARAPRPAASELLPGGGYAVLRSALRPAEDRLVFDCGPLGYLPHASHGHADLLSVLVDVGGEELLTDPGTFAYYDPAGRRDLFRATRMHNTVEVGGRDQADAFDPFKWLNIPASGLATCRLGADFDYVEAWHDGYRRLRSPVRHRRAVLGVGGGWLVVDWLEGRGDHAFIRRFHAVPGARVERVDAAAVRVWTPSGNAALVLRDVTAAAGAEVGSAPHSERYGHEIPAPVVRFVERAALPALRLTLLVPEHDGPDGAGLRVAALEEEAGRLRVRLEDVGGCATSISLCPRSAPRRVGSRMRDARAVVMREGAPPRISPGPGRPAGRA